MKERCTPRLRYDGDAGYPATAGLPSDRRTFLGQALAGAAALAGLALPRAARAKPADPGRQKVNLSLDAYTPIAGTQLRFKAVDVWTADRDLARFLRDPAQRAKLRMAALAPLRLATAQTLESGKRIYALERQVAGRLAEHYLKETRRRVTAPDVMLHVGERYAVHTGGVVSQPLRGHYP